MADHSIEERISPPSTALDRQPDHAWIRRPDTSPVAVGVADGAAVSEATLRTSGLGSCVAIVVCDWTTGIGGLVHPMLPEPDGPSVVEPGRFVSTAVPALVDTTTTLGADDSALTALVVGGAAMIEFSSSGPGIGDRNAQRALDALSRYDIPVVQREIGGTTGRSVTVDLAAGSLSVREAGREESVTTHDYHR